MQYRFDRKGGNALGQRRSLQQMNGMVRVVAVVHLPAHDLAAVQIQNQVQVKPAAHHGGRQVRHIPAPDLTHGRGDMRGGRAHSVRCFGASPVCRLPVCTQHARQAGLTAQVHAFVGQHGNDARWRHGGEARLVGHIQQSRAFLLAQCVTGRGTHRQRPAIALCEARVGLPALQGA